MRVATLQLQKGAQDLNCSLHINIFLCLTLSIVLLIVLLVTRYFSGSKYYGDTIYSKSKYKRDLDLLIHSFFKRERERRSFKNRVLSHKNHIGIYLVVRVVSITSNLFSYLYTVWSTCVETAIRKCFKINNLLSNNFTFIVDPFDYSIACLEEYQYRRDFQNSIQLSDLKSCLNLLLLSFLF